ncbi:MAG: helix-turn-helix transcriptional regulator [Rhodospirillaceae bacterium]|nr:helix-turn-helix transcriptional regulator [Rhodospirillaceae bacterium]
MLKNQKITRRKKSPSKSNLSSELSGGQAAQQYDVRYLGERLRELRLQKNLTVKKLATLSKVPASTISKMENGHLKPSLVHAINLASALDENLGFLVDRYRRNPTEFVVLRATDRTEIEFPDMNLVLEDLNRNFHSGILEARLGTLETDASSGNQPMEHEGEEFCHVLDGAIRYVIEDEEFELHQGDSIHFKSNLGHSWENISDGLTRVIWVFSDGLSF